MRHVYIYNRDELLAHKRHQNEGNVVDDGMMVSRSSGGHDSDLECQAPTVLNVQVQAGMRDVQRTIDWMPTYRCLVASIELLL